MNVNKPSPQGTESFRSLQILDELSKNDSLTQRDLSSHLGIALGLVNSYIKNLVKKGFITVKAIPPKRYTYYLTPKGFSEKTRLTYHMLNDYTRVYREARKNLQQLFHDLQLSGMKKIVFAGADEIAEIAYISLQETSLELSGVVNDETHAEQKFFGIVIQPLQIIHDLTYDCVVVTSYLHREKIYQKLTALGIDKEKIRIILSLEEGGTP